MIGLAAGAAAIGRKFRRRKNEIYGRNHPHSRNTGRQ
jgi:hypothetical protein